ncbi:hypothetical protein PFISCL1PPCAC_4837 [Pristionchus fissidentatus]|uniref:Uncharacterized protein n=1 Tax=Pristionchus fissidentatus TaxID=1538716 RepID=A0AAV5V4T4_9BILA|nr:hypothetical protein PFISCL1PPCAC_4837 [Pristionchus fissidentatus]
MPTVISKSEQINARLEQRTMRAECRHVTAGQRVLARRPHMLQIAHRLQVLHGRHFGTIDGDDGRTVGEAHLDAALRADSEREHVGSPLASSVLLQLLLPLRLLLLLHLRLDLPLALAIQDLLGGRVTQAELVDDRLCVHLRRLLLVRRRRVRYLSLHDPLLLLFLLPQLVQHPQLILVQPLPVLLNQLRIVLLEGGDLALRLLHLHLVRQIPHVDLELLKVVVVVLEILEVVLLQVEDLLEPLADVILLLDQRVVEHLLPERVLLQDAAAHVAGRRVARVQILHAVPAKRVGALVDEHDDHLIRVLVRLALFTLLHGC